MIKYKVIVRSMTATYEGEVYAENEEDAVNKVRADYRKKNDDRMYWDIKAFSNNNIENDKDDWELER